MKRLIKKAFGQTLYHGTSFENFQNVISQGGLSPQMGDGIAGEPDPTGEKYEKDYDGFVFLAIDIERAYGYALGQSENIAVVIEVDIDPQALLPDNVDDPTAKTWQESAEEIAQVKINGTITTDYFRNIYFYDQSTMKYHEPTFTAQVSNWQAEYEKNKDKF